MARQLIKAARARDDASLPGIDSICHNIYRWERGTVGLTERYKLYYCVGRSDLRSGAGPGCLVGGRDSGARPGGRGRGAVAEFRREMAITRDGGGAGRDGRDTWPFFLTVMPPCG